MFAICAVNNKNKVIGVACCFKSLLNKIEYSPWLGMFCVEKLYRNQGIGTSLHQLILQELHKRGFKECFLYTSTTEDYYLKKEWFEIEKTQGRISTVTIMKYCFNDTLVDL